VVFHGLNAVASMILACASASTVVMSLRGSVSTATVSGGEPLSFHSTPVSSIGVDLSSR
jgi:hypothetical protein